MNNTAAGNHQQLDPGVLGSWDHVAPQDQMKAIRAALQQYFGADDWLARRNKRFPGLSGAQRYEKPRNEAADGPTK